MSSRKPFCKMCFNADKTEREYTSHWLRSHPGPSGVVVCPYLLSIECRYCHTNGHTVSKCPILAKKNKCYLKPLGPPPPLIMPDKKNVEPAEEVVVEPVKLLGKRKYTPKMSWADMCDSDSDDDY